MYYLKLLPLYIVVELEPQVVLPHRVYTDPVELLPGPMSPFLPGAPSLPGTPGVPLEPSLPGAPVAPLAPMVPG